MEGNLSSLCLIPLKSNFHIFSGPSLPLSLSSYPFSFGTIFNNFLAFIFLFHQHFLFSYLYQFFLYLLFIQRKRKLYSLIMIILQSYYYLHLFISTFSDQLAFNICFFFCVWSFSILSSNYKLLDDTIKTRIDQKK